MTDMEYPMPTIAVICISLACRGLSGALSVSLQDTRGLSLAEFAQGDFNHQPVPVAPEGLESGIIDQPGVGDEDMRFAKFDRRRQRDADPQRARFNREACLSIEQRRDLGPPARKIAALPRPPHALCR